ncbi:MAG: glutamine synthetase family protein [Thiofilum sp.]|uniref:glutamine synthetase family protein n=1 Tax=Thiofilum sp. TaxID=2212733 RepID=UPI0025DC1D64|nr:glutamine synthetase family protein [Thiofilum sp.]MBK8454818.1 glutamine synthetase [Thiofilum sp.]
MTPPTNPAAEVNQFLTTHPQLSQIALILTDINGIARGKFLRPRELYALYKMGRPLPSSILSLNVLGEDVDSTGLVWEVADQDCIARPIPNTLKMCPWLPNTAQVLVSMDKEAGMPAAAADPRLCLVEVVERLKADGSNPVLACELEFYLLDKAAWQQGKVVTATTPNGFNLEQTQVYGVGDLEDMRGFFADVYKYSAIQGLPAETAISEYAPAQFEITLVHRTDAVQAVDEAIQFKRLIKGVAEQHGMIACFMAKPFTERSGSGMHIHVSFTNSEGINLFSAGETETNQILLHSIGGMAATIKDAMAIFAPHANSYRRFKANSYAPTAATWGINNRTVTFRVPSNNAANRHVEHRASGADANPYLAAAAVLAGMHYGIKHKIDADKPATGNAYSDTRVLPLNWYDTLDAFEHSTFIREYLGADFQRIYSALKWEECERFNAEVSSLDHQWHLRLA